MIIIITIIIIMIIIIIIRRLTDTTTDKLEASYLFQKDSRLPFSAGTSSALSRPYHAKLQLHNNNNNNCNNNNIFV